MPTSNLTTIIKHSLYWLLPVILLNVFTNAGLQASAVELPFQVQTELRFSVEQPPASPFLVPASIVAKLAAAPNWSGLMIRSFMTSTQVIPPVVSVPAAATNQLRFYGKAAPEALDAWSWL